MTLYELLLSVVGPVPLADGIGGLMLWISGCLLTLIAPLYALYYISRIMLEWSK